MPSKKKIRIFAGPNGSGKSTLFHEFSKNYNTGFFINADILEKKLADSGLIDLSELGLDVSQQDLDAFKILASSQSLFHKANEAGHQIDVFVKDNFIVDASKETHSYEGAFIASFIRHMLLIQNKPLIFLFALSMFFLKA